MHFIRRTAIVATALLVGMFATGAGPAHADPACSSVTAPDGKIRLQGGPWIGAGTYGLSTASAPLAPGQQVIFDLKWRNSSSAARAIHAMRQSSSIAEGMRVRFYLHGENMTGAFKGSGVVFEVAPSKATPRVELLVKNRGTQPLPVKQLMTGMFDDLADVVCDQLEATVNPYPEP